MDHRTMNVFVTGSASGFARHLLARLAVEPDSNLFLGVFNLRSPLLTHVLRQSRLNET